MAGMSSVRVHALTKRYGSVTALFEVSFDVPPGGTIALLGPNGCGKTSILRCLAGLETPDWGSIEIDGEPVFDRDRGIDIPPERRGLGIVFRSHGVWPHMTVADNVAFPLKVRGVPAAIRLDRANEMLELVGLRGFAERSANLVSAGQRQRIALARALIHEPGLVLFDEVLSTMEFHARQQMRMELRALQQRLGFTAIYVTHDHAEAFGLADRIILMNRGAIETIGTAKALFLHPPTAYAARFFGINVLEGRLLGPATDKRYLEVELSARLIVRGVPAPDHEFPEGGRVLACIRKDAVRIFRPRPGEEAAGVIVTASFLGAGEEYIVDIAGVRIETSGQVAGLAEGDKVHVTMTPDDWVIVR
jgi:iron(III) transport system ATP-binding protein